MSDLKFNNVTEAINWKNNLLEKKVLLNGNLTFSVMVTCQHEGGYFQENLHGTIEINGYTSGNIYLNDGSYINSTSAPMSFWSFTQSYYYNTVEKCLIITGRHPKYLNYTIKIYTM